MDKSKDENKVLYMKRKECHCEFNHIAKATKSQFEMKLSLRTSNWRWKISSTMWTK